MKNKYFVGLVVFALFLIPVTFASPAQAQVAACPAGYTCTPVSCPAGYVCTPVNPQPASCPAGYVCVPATCNAGYTFTTNLTIGSTGPDVVAIQTWLIANGFSIPEISSGSVAKGNYDAQTAAAVSAYQTAHGLPQTGNLDVATRSYLNSGCTPVTPTTDATVTIVGTPSEVLTYDSANSEVALNAKFTVAINGGTQGINVYKQGPNVFFSSVDGSNGVNGKLLAFSPLPGSTAGSASDTGGQAVWVVPAGQTINFLLVGSVNPKQMFAGTYYASMPVLSGVVGLNAANYVKLSPTNTPHTNNVTIVGEVSPFITQVTPNPIASGQKLSINGARLIGAMGQGNLYIDNIASTALVDGSKDGTILFFTLPALTDGYHVLYVRDNVTGTGASNNVGFQVQNASCVGGYQWTTNLTVGDTGPDVVALQTWLLANGYDIPAISSGAVAKGYFGSATAAALAKYQVSVGINEDGFLGPLTRNKLNNSSCGPTQPSITVVSPNGGESYQQGSVIPVTWSENYSAPSLHIDVYGFNGMVYSGKTSGGTGKNMQNLPPEASNVPTGQYQVNVCDDSQSPAGLPGKSLCDHSDTYFKITSGTSGNQPPAINGGTFPVSLNVGQSGTWTVQASDPENGPLSYSILWGDENQPGTATKGVVAGIVTQTATFTHTYINAGTYNPTFTVTDNGGLTAKNTATVQVGGGSTPSCPAGYICTPPGGTINCPVGYTCTPTVITSCPSGYTCWAVTQNKSVAPTAADITNLYVTLLSRPADASAFAYWGGNGFTLDQVRQGILNSLEYNTKQQIRALYISLLHRALTATPGDDAGLAYWYGIAAQSNYNTSAVKTGIMNGIEYQLKQKVIALFQSCLNRQPTDAELAQWYNVAYNNGSNMTAVSQGLGCGTQPTTGSATLSLDAATPITSTVPVTDTTNGQYLGLPILVFDIHNGSSMAEHLSSLRVNLSLPGNIAAAYLYQGSTLVTSASVSSGVATFKDIVSGTAGSNIPANVTVPYTIKVDVTGVNTGGVTVSANVNSSGVSAQDANNNAVTVSGSAQGNPITVVAGGPQFSLAGAPTIVKQTINSGTTTLSQYIASFNIQVQAVGASITLGLPNSSSPALAPNATSLTVIENGVPNTVSPNDTVVSYAAPTNTTISNDGSSFTLGANQTVTMPVTVSFIIAHPGADVFSVRLNAIRWNGTQISPLTAALTPSAFAPTNAFSAAPSQADLTASIWYAIQQYLKAH